MGLFLLSYRKPHVYTYIRAYQCLSIEDDFNESCQCHELNHELNVYTHIDILYSRIVSLVFTYPYTYIHMGWLRLVGSLKLLVSFAKEPYKADDILQKRPVILRSLLIVATPYVSVDDEFNEYESTEFFVSVTNSIYIHTFTHYTRILKASYSHIHIHTYPYHSSNDELNQSCQRHELNQSF